MFTAAAKAASTRSPPDGVFSVEWLKTSGVRIAVIGAVALVVSWIGRAAVRRMRRRLEGADSKTKEHNLRRATTITSTLTNTILVVVWTIAILLALGELGVNLGPLLAGAGVAGVAISFGAQSLVRDFLSGFFVIFEDQYRVGDSVSITASGGSFAGKVEDLTLRYTSVRAADGTLFEVGNGNILFVANRSRGTGRITVDVLVPKAGSVHEMERRLDEAVEAMRVEPTVRELVTSGPTKVGLEPIDRDQVQATISAEIRASRRDQAEATLRRELSRRLHASNTDPDASPAGDATVDPDRG